MYPLIDVNCDSDALYVNLDAIGARHRHPEPGSADAREVASNPRDDKIESNNSSLDVDSDFSSSEEQFRIVMIFIRRRRPL